MRAMRGTRDASVIAGDAGAVFWRRHGNTGLLGIPDRIDRIDRIDMCDIHAAEQAAA